MKRLLALLSIAVLCAGLSVAQRGGGRRAGGGGRSAARSLTEDQLIETFVLLLQLGETQKNDLKKVLDAALPGALAPRKEIEDGKDSLFEAAKGGKSDDEIDRIANTQADLTFKMKALEARTFAKFHHSLAAAQQAKADSFFFDQMALFLESGEPPAAH